MNKMKGFVQKIVFKNEDNGYTILEFIEGGTAHTLVGEMSPVEEGDILECEAETVTHPVYGDQYRVVSYCILPPENAQQMEMYLASGAVKGVGASLAARIVRIFGEDTFRIMEEEPELLAKVKGISLRKAREIALAMQEKRETRAPLIFLQSFGIGGALATKLVKKYGEEIYACIRENPYRLADEVEGIGFKRADEIAIKSGIGETSEYRIRGAILYVLKQAASNGHCCLPGNVMYDRANELLGTPAQPEMVENELTALMLDNRIKCMTSDNRPGEAGLLREDMSIYESRVYREEEACAAKLSLCIKAFLQEGDRRDPEYLSEIDAAEKALHIQLDEWQRKAVLSSLQEGVVIITGGPGTGKTTTINMILQLFSKMGLETALAAPTGRAAKRMTEASGRESRTIHRLLEVEVFTEDGAASRTGFARDADNPLEYDAVIIDEMSMVDIHLFYALLRAVTPGTRLILVGDAAQLPSVGPGQVLRDLIESACIPTITLNKIFRQEEAGDIVKNAHRIHNGEEISLDNKSNKDFFFMTREDVQTVRQTLVRLMVDNLPKYLGVSSSQIQVLTPMKKGDLGVHALNSLLQQHINPAANHKKEYSLGERILREGDKVMQVKNNYQLEWRVRGAYNTVTAKGLGVFNGDLGIIQRIDTALRNISVCFDDNKVVTYTFQEAEELELAYAVTIHKSQGSEYPAVILPLLGGPRQLLNRNVLYTAVTRAKNLAVLMGSQEVVREMIANDTQAERYTGLMEKIRRAYGG